MAQLPDLRRIRIEDIKEPPKWLSLLITPINRFMETVYYALNKDLTFQDNIKSQIETFDVEADSINTTGQKLRIKINQKPVGVILLSIVKDSTFFDPVAAAIGIDWTIEDEFVKIQNISGLTATENYKVTVLII